MTEPEDVRAMNFPDPLRDDLHFIRAMTAAKWTAADFQMPKSQLGIETDTGKMKVGEGKKWSATSYVSSAPTAHSSSHQPGGTDAIANVVVSPAEITANQNNYTLASGDIFRMTADDARDITGVAAGTSGQAALLINVGSNAITLKHQSASSTAANRIIVPGAVDYALAASGGTALLVYDATSSRWRVI